MAGRPAKTAAIIEMEGKSHRTKAELEIRRKGEAANLSGQKIKARKEVKADPIANEEFKRVVKILRSIDKDDAGYEAVVNRYAMLFSECKALKERAKDIIEAESDLKSDPDMDAGERAQLLLSLEADLNKIDSNLQQKRKMMFDIEKENLMTIASQLRSVPKAPKAEMSPLARALMDG